MNDVKDKKILTQRRREMWGIGRNIIAGVYLAQFPAIILAQRDNISPQKLKLDNLSLV